MRLEDDKDVSKRKRYGKSTHMTSKGRRHEAHKRKKVNKWQKLHERQVFIGCEFEIPHGKVCLNRT